MQPWNASLDPTTEVEKELQVPFGDGSGPLIRLTLFHGVDQSTVMLTAHHSAADGRTSLFILQDLLALVAGEELHGEPKWLSANALLHQPAPAPYLHTLKQNAQPPPGVPPALPPTQVRSLPWSRTETQALMEKAKSRGCSLQAAFVVAFSTVSSRHAMDAHSPAVRCATPIDIRPFGQAPDAVGMLVINDVSVVPEASLPFWDQALLVHAGLQTVRTADGILRFVQMTNELLVSENSILDLVPKFPGTFMDYSLIVTNAGGYVVRSEYGVFRVTALLLAGASGSVTAQNICINTLDGALSMVHGSRQPIDSLLEEARDLLSNL